MRLSTHGLTSEEKTEIIEFSEWILNVGNGQISTLGLLDESDDSFVSIPSDLLLENSCEPISTIVSTIYPTICDIHVDAAFFRERAIVTTKNTTVAEINDFVLNIAPGEKRVYLSVDSICTSSTENDDANSLYPIEYINQLEFNGVPSHQLALKVGTPVMLLRNISPSMGLCNGTRLIITQLSSKVIQAQIITGVMALPIKSIKKYNFYKSLHGRVCRVWIPRLNGQNSSFNCLFVDATVSIYMTPLLYHLSFFGDGIQASAKGKNIQQFAASIIEGDYYEICGFYTFENRYTNSVVAHEAVIDLKSDTKVIKIDPTTPPIRRHYFTFIDFAHLLTTGRRSGVLTDVLGRLKGVQPLEQIMVRGQDLTDKREFIIENIRGEELRITLWGDVAKSFDDSDLSNQASPVIIVFAGFRITEFRGKPNLASTVASLWYFNPEIQEILPYKHYYKDTLVEVHQLPSTTSIQTIDEQLKENRKTIKEILCMDPYQYKV
ncbi:replication protein DNA-binding [Salix suchowensis]|nr:replication protein DNA-binding [Salix suchowensis]